MTNNNKAKVMALVVTYNRLELLKRCISYLQNQTLKPDILIINNSSSDGTLEYLVNSNIDHITQENSGSAGGWHSGLAEGWKRGYDYIWMMDDDGFPDINALDKLVNCFESGTICVSSLVVKENDPQALVFGMPKINKRGFPKILASKRKYEQVNELPLSENKYPHAHLFNGALIDLSAAKEIGQVDTSYFMYGDEVDYFYRMKKKGKVFSAINALHYHPDVSQRSIDKKKVYYFIRNTIILNHKYFDKAIARDFLTICIAMYRIMRRNGFGQMVSYFIGPNRKYFYPAIIDGFRDRRINRF